MHKVIIYCDGSCSPNPGPGGWGAVLNYKGNEREISGGALNTTNNRMELQAAIEAIKAVTRPMSIVVHTDSNYVVRGMTEWSTNWVKNNWRTSNKGAVKNADLWKELLAVCAQHQVEWKWVKAHAGIALNERADQLANEGLERTLASL